MLVSVRLFAGLRERAGTDRLQVELPEGARVADVLAAMAATPVGELRPRSASWPSTASTRPPTRPSSAGDEVALVPPVSGGAGAVRHVRVTGHALDLAALADAVRDPRAGAVVVFEGVTREVAELEYEAYAEMAESQIEAIADEEAERHGLCAVAVEHRSGTVALSRAVGHRRRLRAASRRGVRRRPRDHRPRQGRGPDLEGRGHRRRPAARRGHAPVYVTRRTSGSRLGVKGDFTHSRPAWC